ncbi:MAG: carbamoyltransferase HypF [Actinobacteria bacterium]|nr:carbamoyltransferase HypF [Actinomycetota bacterium]
MDTAAHDCGSGASTISRKISVRGAVQGVGFRPFVHALATTLGLSGRVWNTSEGVEIEVAGPADRVGAFEQRLTDDAPPLALVESVVATATPAGSWCGFSIAPSTGQAGSATLVTADAATCADCLDELFDPDDRRFRYPFINCTSCGPRFTITKSVPYDRPATTMAGFTMCALCSAEYEDPTNRRFHAQPNACPTCGPTLAYYHRPDRLPDHLAVAQGPSATRAVAQAPRWRAEDALTRAVAELERGGIVAVKGLGGYHLACDATREGSVATLRARKHRDEKPFAVMVDSLEAAEQLCVVSPEEAALLTSTRRPVVLLEQRDVPPAPPDVPPAPPDVPPAPPDVRDTRPTVRLAPSVAPGVTTYGLFLPYTPLHHLLAQEVGVPLVMTSGNLSDEPIAYDDEDAHRRLGPLADGFLSHDRPIHIRTDDSVARVFRGEPYLLRRARGWAPLPVRFNGSDTSILAVGGHLKNTFAITRGSRAFVSHHIGDLENLQTLRSLEEAVAHFQGLFGLEPALVAHDLHPDYLSSRFARDFAAEHGLPLLAIRHHEAHIASVLADAGHEGPVVGLALDGAGYGADGTIWGGEVFVGAAGSLKRVGHLDHLPLPGGDAAVREPWRLAIVLLDACGREPDASLPGGGDLLERPWELVLQAARAGLNTPLTSSAGRLFDAISALLGIRHEVSYEGQAAIMLETAARRWFSRNGLPEPDRRPRWLHDDGAGWITAAAAHAAPDSPDWDSDAPMTLLPLQPYARALLADVAGGRSREETAAAFHHALAWVFALVAERTAADHSLDTVALSGGVFQNILFADLLATRLEHTGLRVLRHRNVPTNDGGICLGQAETAAAALRSGSLGPGVAP